MPTWHISSEARGSAAASRQQCRAEPTCVRGDASRPHLSEIDDRSQDTGACGCGSHSLVHGLSPFIGRALGKASPGGEPRRGFSLSAAVMFLSHRFCAIDSRSGDCLSTSAPRLRLDALPQKGNFLDPWWRTGRTPHEPIHFHCDLWPYPYRLCRTFEVHFTGTATT